MRQSTKTSKKYYKVVSIYKHKNNEEFYSCRLAKDYKDWKVRYLVNKFVTPTMKNTKLMVFDSLGEALNFKSWHAPEAIFEVKVINPTKSAPFLHRNFIRGAEIIWKLWASKKKYRHLMSRDWDNNLDLPPKGTVFVDAVKLIKRVD